MAAYCPYAPTMHDRVRGANETGSPTMKFMIVHITGSRYRSVRCIVARGRTDGSRAGALAARGVCPHLPLSARCPKKQGLARSGPSIRHGSSVFSGKLWIYPAVRLGWLRWRRGTCSRRPSSWLGVCVIFDCASCVIYDIITLIYDLSCKFCWQLATLAKVV